MFKEKCYKKSVIKKLNNEIQLVLLQINDVTNRMEKQRIEFLGFRNLIYNVQLSRLVTDG